MCAECFYFIQSFCLTADTNDCGHTPHLTCHAAHPTPFPSAFSHGKSVLGSLPSVSVLPAPLQSSKALQQCLLAQQAPLPSQHGEFAPTGAPGGAPLQEEPGHSAAGADHTDQRGNPPPCFHLSSAFQSVPLMCCFSFITAPFASQSCPRLWPSITPSAITRNISSACPALLFPQTHSVPLLLQDTFFQPR